MSEMHFEEIASTNEFLKEFAKKGVPDRSFVSADRQSAGHGQYQRCFESPPGGLYFSLLRKTEKYGDDVSNITAEIGKIMQRQVLVLFGVKAEIKPPNDLLVNGKKLCGILCESFVQDGILNIIIGVGLNVNTLPEDYSKELRNNAVSIRMLTGKSYELSDILCRIKKNINLFLDNYGG